MQTRLKTKKAVEASADIEATAILASLKTNGGITRARRTLIEKKSHKKYQNAFQLGGWSFVFDVPVQQTTISQFQQQQQQQTIKA